MLSCTCVASCIRGASCHHKLRGLCWFWSNGEDVHFHPEVQIVERIQDLIFVVQGFVETLVVDVSVPQAAEVPAPQFPKPVVGVKAPTQRVP